MDDLPGEIVRIIAWKLAAKNTSSLLRVTCACKAFYLQVKGDPKIWKQFFCGGNSRLQVDERLEAVIMLLGRYKRLVKARWERKLCFRYEQTQGPGLVSPGESDQ